jgi:hypothetical protein
MSKHLARSAVRENSVQNEIKPNAMPNNKSLMH